MNPPGLGAQMADLLNDRYQLGDVVGSGGMGAVYRATDTRLGRTVAIKVLRGGPLADESARARMRSEALLAASIHHPGVAQVFDFDEDRSREGLTFIVMQYVDGHTLAQLLREQGPLPADQVMSVVVQVAEGLQAAHEAGVVHRDLKPANIMLTPAGRTVLVDFGIAWSATSEPLTDTGTLVGTADYMSPEQAAGRLATPQSDLYALGVIAHHCLTGQSPFRRESHIATAIAHLNDDLPALDTSVPADVKQLVEVLAAKDPAGRPTSAAAVALQAAAIGATGSIDLPTTFERPVLETPDPAGARTLAASEVTSASGPRSRRPTVTYAGTGAVVLLLGLFGLLKVWPSGDHVVPRVVGMSVAEASGRVREAGLVVRPRSVDVAGKSKGEVVKQFPVGGARVPGDDSVELSVATGKVVVAAGDVIGMTYVKAAAALEKLGFEVVRKDVSKSSGAGDVVALDESGRLPEGASITLSVAVTPVAAPTQTTSSSSSSTGRSSAGSRGSHGNGKAKGKKKGGK